MYKCYYIGIIEYQKYFLGSKVGRCVGLTALPPQTPGTLRACPDVCREFYIQRTVDRGIFL